MTKKFAKPQRIAIAAGAFALAFSMAALAGCGSSSPAPAANTSSSAAPAAAAPADTSAAAAPADTSAAAAPTAAAEALKVQSGTVTTNIDMTNYDAGKTVQVWVPYPSKGAYQAISDREIVAEGAARAEITTTADGNRMAYIEWAADADPATRIAEVSFHATRNEAVVPVDQIVESGEVPEDIAAAYLGSSAMVAADDPEVIALAQEITAGKETYVDKARAVYDWIYDNMERDNDVVGCGDGDVCRLITPEERAGKCTDINSVFVALCRAAGVPATEMFGIRMNADDITGNQHCWAEFYVPGTGWVPADPADVLKAVLNDKLDKASDEALAKKEYYWGAWDEKRVEYSHGRDLVLEPAQAGPALNDFGYPYAEVDGEPIDFYKPAEFIYSVSFVEDPVIATAPKKMDTPMQKMAADELLAALDAKDDSIVIVDLRKPEDFAAGHIDGAIAATMQAAVENGDYAEGYQNIQNALQEATGSLLGEGKSIVLVCYTGNKYAQAATDVLNDLGADMSKVYTLDGGAKGWAEAGNPVVE